MSRMYIALLLAGTSCIGLLRLFSRHKTIVRTRSFVDEYLDRFVRLAGQSPAKFLDGQDYRWLTRRVAKIQSVLGGYGESLYKPAFANYILRNYPLLMNTLPDMLRGMAHPYDVQTCIECLERYIGVLEEEISTSKVHLRNPLKWLAEGVQTIFLMPWYVLHWSGVISTTHIQKAAGNVLLRVMSATFTFAGLVGSAVTIALGWGKFSNLVKNLLQRILG